MQKNEEYEKLLTNLGMTICQAKVYLALANLIEPSSVQTIAKTAELAREKTYCVMPDLQKMGLVEKLITRPVKYKAIPVQEGLTTLLKRKNNEHNKLRQKVKKAVSQPRKYTKKPNPKEEAQFCLIPGDKEFLKRLTSSYACAQQNVSAIITGDMFRRYYQTAPEIVESIMKNGAECRVITYKTKAEPVPKGATQLIKKYPNFKVKYTKMPLNHNAEVIDGKQIFMALTEAKNPVFSPHLWSNNSILISIMQEHFENMWNTSTSE